MGMLTQADRRVPRGAGFHLTEVLVTAMVIGLLASVAIPSYRAFQGRAHTAAAEAAVRSVLPAVEAYVLHNGDYGFDRTVDGTPAKSAAEALRSYGGALPRGVAVASVGGGRSYCVSAADAGDFRRKDRPADRSSSPRPAAEQPIETPICSR